MSALIKDADGAFNLDSAHRGRETEDMSTCLYQKLDDRNANKLKFKNELTHTANRNCASPSSGGEEQKWTLVVGHPSEKCVLDQAHAWGGGWT
jgi:hypothetical protein